MRVYHKLRHMPGDGHSSTPWACTTPSRGCGALFTCTAGPKRPSVSARSTHSSLPSTPLRFTSAIGGVAPFSSGWLTSSRRVRQRGRASRDREGRTLAALGFGRHLAGGSDRTVRALLFLQLLAGSLTANGLVAGATDPTLKLALLALIPADHAAPHGSPYGPKVQ